MFSARDLNSLLSILVNSLHDGGGFARVALALLDPRDTDRLLGRVVVGVDEPTRYLCSFNGSLSADHPLLLQVLKRHDPLIVSNFLTVGSHALHATFISIWQASGANSYRQPTDRAPLQRPWSYSTEISPHDLQSFQFFLSQAILRLNRLAGVL
ncbi:MAG TPA: hypothetical protein VJU02_07435 [Nitrospiraceae bacterium]|nr:hypothetical protein [Nitrospiraceae bacterium]